MATYYVRTDGNDSNAGTTDSAAGAWLTIQKACNTVAAGDTVIIHGGTYSETPVLTTDGTSGSRITFKNYTGESVVVDAGAPTSDDFQAYIMRLNGASYITIQADGGTFEFKRGNGHGIKLNDNTNCILDGLLIHDTQYVGIYGYLSYTNEVRNCTVHTAYDGAGGGDSDGISFTNNFSVEAGNNIIENNTVYDISDDAIDVFYMTGNTIRNNKVYNVGSTYVGGGSGNGNGLKIGPGGSNKVYNNRIKNCDNAGITGNEGPSNEVYNNSVYVDGAGNYTYAQYGTGATGCIYKNNIAYGSGSVLMDTSPTESHNTWNLSITDPSWVSTDPTSADFMKIPSTSACKDAGTSISGVFTTDYLGTSRPQGSNWDVGAHEYIPTSIGDPGSAAGILVAALL